MARPVPPTGFLVRCLCQLGRPIRLDDTKIRRQKPSPASCHRGPSRRRRRWDAPGENRSPRRRDVVYRRPECLRPAWTRTRPRSADRPGTARRRWRARPSPSRGGSATKTSSGRPAPRFPCRARRPGRPWRRPRRLEAGTCRPCRLLAPLLVRLMGDVNQGIDSTTPGVDSYTPSE
jgi:hypothetical protein